MSEPRKEVIHTRIWQEEPEPDNPFATRIARCHGFDVYGDMLGNARWVDMLYLLFKGDAPTATQAALLEALAVALANPGPRDASVHAAMCGGVGGSTAASCLMAALAVGAGGYGGGLEVRRVMEAWELCNYNIDSWAMRWIKPPQPLGSVWPAEETPAGFDPYTTVTSTPVRQTLQFLATLGGDRLHWALAQLPLLERISGRAITMSFVAGTALLDLGMSPPEGEMLTLILRLPGAAAHAIEQHSIGVKHFPFFDIVLSDDPANQEAT